MLPATVWKVIRKLQKIANHQITVKYWGVEELLQIESTDELLPNLAFICHM